MPGFGWKESRHPSLEREDEYGSEGDGQMGTKSHIYCEPWPARDREKSISGCQRSRTQNRTPVRGLFWVGGEGGKNVRNQHALRRLKTVQAWRKSLNEFKAARLTCLGCGGKDAVFCRLFTDTYI